MLPTFETSKPATSAWTEKTNETIFKKIKTFNSKAEQMNNSQPKKMH